MDRPPTCGTVGPLSQLWCDRCARLCNRERPQGENPGLPDTRCRLSASCEGGPKRRCPLGNTRNTETRPLFPRLQPPAGDNTAQSTRKRHLHYAIPTFTFTAAHFVLIGCFVSRGSNQPISARYTVRAWTYAP